MTEFLRTIWYLILIIILSPILSSDISAQKFVHPGINQTSGDLAYMKSLILKGEQPYKDAFNRLKAETDTDFEAEPYRHVLRGPYGKPNIGGNDLSKSANMAYNYALMWYITNEKAYADKAIKILNTWSPALWDFDYNDAKLLAAWTGHVFCNAAEILRYTNSGWQQKDIDRFTNMLMSAYYPLMRYYYPQANGNWDGAIIHSIMAIAVFTDNRKMFNNAVDHFLHGPVNGSIFKYIYPDGQCQESTRDQGHVQLGLGEFAGAAQVAYTQGEDLFSIGNNRIALGYEYTAGFLSGEKRHCYGIISERAKNFRDDYEYVYRHYTANGIDLPYTKIAADSIRPKASRSILTSVRLSYSTQQKDKKILKYPTKHIAGAGSATALNTPSNAIIVEPGQSIQKALDEAAGTGRWVLAKSGLHTLPATIELPSGVTLAGEGINTVLFLDPASGKREAILNRDDDLHDVTIRDLVIECGLKTAPPSDPNSIRSYRGGYNRGGILFRSLSGKQMKKIDLVNLTVQNGTYNGVYISGASNLNITNCNFSENGVSVSPGQKLLHNLLLVHCKDINVRGCRLVNSPYGSGVALDHCANVSVSNSEISRNGYYGLLISESEKVTVTNNLIEGNDRSGVMMEFLQNGSQYINITNNIAQYNAGYGIEGYSVRNSNIQQNSFAGNDNDKEQQKLSSEKYIIMK
jgi:parallel beta-helix repeat protein